MNGAPSSLYGPVSRLHDKQLILTVVNPSVQESRDAEIAIREASLKSGTATVLSHTDIHAHNTFQKRDAVTPVDEAVQALGRTVHFTFSPGFGHQVELDLAIGAATGISRIAT